MGRIDGQPSNGTLKVASAMSCAKELYELGDMTEEAFKAMSVHFIEIAGYERISEGF